MSAGRGLGGLGDLRAWGLRRLRGLKGAKWWGGYSPPDTPASLPATAPLTPLRACLLLP